MSRYSKPAGYATSFLDLTNRVYRAFNGYVSGSAEYAPSRFSYQTVTFTFGAAPATLSQITVPDGPNNQPSTPNLKTFTFTWAGSPGAGIIPLVAGGGTAAQAATAAMTTLNAQLTNWVATNPSAGVMVLTSRLRGMNVGPGLVGATNITLTTLLAGLTKALPAAAGKVRGWLSGGSTSAT